MAAGGVVPSLVYFGYLYMASLFFPLIFFYISIFLDINKQNHVMRSTENQG